jgi:1-acyl-sn-glycerol-3-phosphate acyltransferase
MDSRFSPTVVRAFELVFRPWMHRRIRVLITGLPRDLDAGRPLVIAANHVSWWDGFLLREVQRRVRPNAPHYTLMTRRELDRFPFFRRLGVVGIDPGSAGSVLRALRVLEARVAERPDSVVGFFPQGRIWPSYRRPLGFRRGVERFARRLSAQVLPIGIHAEPLNAPAPSLFLNAGEIVEPTVPVARLETEVERLLDDLFEFLALHGESAAAVWPGPNGSLRSGRSRPEPAR